MTYFTIVSILKISFGNKTEGCFCKRYYKVHVQKSSLPYNLRSRLKGLALLLVLNIKRQYSCICCGLINIHISDTSHTLAMRPKANCMTHLSNHLPNWKRENRIPTSYGLWGWNEIIHNPIIKVYVIRSYILHLYWKNENHNILKAT